MNHPVHRAAVCRTSRNRHQPAPVDRGGCVLPGWCGWLATAALACCVILSAGCSREPDELPRYPVSGTVTFNGTPLGEGRIRFLPDDPSLDLDTGLIEQGRFSFEATAGMKTVSISSTSRVAAPPGDPDEFLLVEVIPPRFNEQSELSADVTRDGPNEFTFELSSDER